ncbi:TPA: hypothetical protein EYG96_02300 [Candidatus Gracilibacteria bacterium]|nr:hypothetical protein [Candidatus Gracilibacteria bacterium]
MRQSQQRSNDEYLGKYGEQVLSGREINEVKESMNDFDSFSDFEKISFRNRNLKKLKSKMSKVLVPSALRTNNYVNDINSTQLANSEMSDAPASIAFDVLITHLYGQLDILLDNNKDVSIDTVDDLLRYIKDNDDYQKPNDLLSSVQTDIEFALQKINAVQNVSVDGSKIGVVMKGVVDDMLLDYNSKRGANNGISSPSVFSDNTALALSALAGGALVGGSKKTDGSFVSLAKGIMGVSVGAFAGSLAQSALKQDYTGKNPGDVVSGTLKGAVGMVADVIPDKKSLQKVGKNVWGFWDDVTGMNRRDAGRNGLNSALTIGSVVAGGWLLKKTWGLLTGAGDIVKGAVPDLKTEKDGKASINWKGVFGTGAVLATLGGGVYIANEMSDATAQKDHNEKQAKAKKEADKRVAQNKQNPNLLSHYLDENESNIVADFFDIFDTSNPNIQTNMTKKSIKSIDELFYNKTGLQRGKILKNTIITSEDETQTIKYDVKSKQYIFKDTSDNAVYHILKFTNKNNTKKAELVRFNADSMGVFLTHGKTVKTVVDV